MYLPDIHHQISNDLPEIFPPTLGRWAMARLGMALLFCPVQRCSLVLAGRGWGYATFEGNLGREEKGYQHLDKIKYNVCT